MKRTAKRKVRGDHTKKGDAATTGVEFSSEEIDGDSSKNKGPNDISRQAADDASTANKTETTDNPQSTLSSIQFNSDIVYYDVFTAFQRHLNIQSSEIDVLQSIIIKIHVADPQRNQNKQSIREKQQVDSWNTKQLPARKDILYLHDDNIGEDSLSSQSTYLHGFYCQRHELDDALLCWDWAESTQSHCLWYCSNVSNSPLLCAAIKKALSKSQNYSKIDPDYFKLLDKDAYQFMGFVSRSLKRSYLSCFHLVSFVLFRTGIEFKPPAQLYTEGFKHVHNQSTSGCVQ